MPAWSGLWDGVHQQPHALIGIAQVRRALRKITRSNSTGGRKFKEQLRTFITDDVGSAAVATHTQIAAGTPFNPRTFGGVRTIETVTDVNANLAAADETALLLEIDNDHTPTFPVEASGNSGGGWLRAR